MTKQAFKAIGKNWLNGSMYLVDQPAANAPISTMRLVAGDSVTDTRRIMYVRLCKLCKRLHLSEIWSSAPTCEGCRYPVYLAVADSSGV